MWGYANDREILTENFLHGMKKVGGKEIEKDRVLTLDELKAFFGVLDDEKAGITDATRLALKVVLLKAQRPGEVAGMMRSELHDLECAKPHWIIPAVRTKNKKAEHTVPLSPTAVRLIEAALEAGKPEGEDTKDRPVFASRFESVETLARHSMSQAVRRLLGDDEEEGMDQAEDGELAAFTPHDLRRTAATIVQAARLPVDYVKALLNHNDKGVTGIYARWHMFEEKHEAVSAIEPALLPILE
ncbi:tyrosine-type recombinase/integrase [Bradyrhizobium sp. CSA207]|uniref:site-specific integrase n=1 Tax=Bradyrhizobium sp. CSA207 TaxID=2698826 RepID=UPI0023AF8D8B|nr:site-specific integrase [Bradyrhizobium sp. CSA207]MDE5444852.1 tyrosine-type recombinase/integrase [Bradyrhizobium sp. CSA207]